MEDLLQLFATVSGHIRIVNITRSVSFKAHTMLLFESLVRNKPAFALARVALTPHHFAALQHAGLQKPQTFDQRGEHGGESPCTWEPCSCNMPAVKTEKTHTRAQFSPQFPTSPNHCLFKPYTLTPRTWALPWLNITGLNSFLSLFASMPLLTSHLRGQILPWKEHFAPAASTGQCFCGWRSSKQEPVWTAVLFYPSLVFFFFFFFWNQAEEMDIKKAVPVRCGKCSSLHLEALCTTYTLANGLHLPHFSFLPEFSLLPTLVQSFITSARKGT